MGTQSRTQTTTYDQPTALETERGAFVWIDPELGRASVAIGASLEYLAYAAGWAAERRSGTGEGRVKAIELAEELAQYVDTEKRSIRRYWIKNGNNLFWSISPDGWLYLYSPERVARRLAEAAEAAGLGAVFATNKPGRVNVLVSIAGSKLAFNGQVLAAWHTTRRHNRNISRAALEALFNATKKTIIQWEKAAGIQVLKSYGLFTSNDLIPDHAYPVVFAREGKHFFRAAGRISNRYQPPAMPVRQDSAAWLHTRNSSISLFEAGIPEAIGSSAVRRQKAKRADKIGYLAAQGKRYFEERDNRQPDQAYKSLHRHLRRDANDRAAHYVKLGNSSRFGDALVFEQNDCGYQLLSPTERVNPRIEAAVLSRMGGRYAVLQGLMNATVLW